MAYIIDGERPLIFCANVRTASTAIANAMLDMGAQRSGHHHDQPFYIPPGSVVFQVIRCPYEVLTSLWFKGRPLGCFECFVRAACQGEYTHVTIPMYPRLAITNNVRYNYLASDLKQVFSLVGLPPPKLERTFSRTVVTADRMFSCNLRRLVEETFDEEMGELGL